MSDRIRRNRRNEADAPAPGQPDALVADAMLQELLAVDELLTRLEAEDPRRARIVECRVFGGMSLEDVADALDLPPAVVKQEWRIAAVHLYQQLQSRAPDS
jgi:DNA-directed RNA polymerase specialized sigma24 family protein